MAPPQSQSQCWLPLANGQRPLTRESDVLLGAGAQIGGVGGRAQEPGTGIDGAGGRQHVGQGRVVAGVVALVEVDRPTAGRHHQGPAVLLGIALGPSLDVAAPRRPDALERGHGDLPQAAAADIVHHLVAAPRGVDERPQPFALLGLEVPALGQGPLADHSQRPVVLGFLGDAAQLRGLVTAVYSTVVAQEDQRGGTVGPDRAKRGPGAVELLDLDVRQLGHDPGRRQRVGLGRAGRGPFGLGLDGCKGLEVGLVRRQLPDPLPARLSLSPSPGVARSG